MQVLKCLVEIRNEVGVLWKEGGERRREGEEREERGRGGKEREERRRKGEGGDNVLVEMCWVSLVYFTTSCDSAEANAGIHITLGRARF